MFMRLIILELDKYSRWIKAIGVLLITLRAADWPYELAFHSITQRMMDQAPQSGSQCWAEWGAGVIILNFVGDALANLFLSGMFVRRLFIHINMSKSLMSHQNKVIERIAQKSLMCLAFTFVVNLAMNLLKVTMFLGDHSDAFTVYFEIIESTLLVEALRNDGNYVDTSHVYFCEGCQKEISHEGHGKAPNNEEYLNSQMLIKSLHTNTDKNNDKSINKYNSTYTEDTAYCEQSQAIHGLSFMEPALLFDPKNPASIRYSAGPSTSSTLQNRTSAALTDAPLPSPSIGKSFSMTNNDLFPMTTQLQRPTIEKTLTPRVSSSILTSTMDLDDRNSDKSSY
ncbi:hypothetical protein [Parasitella parasitica]|uniref:Uncharacterized protein n=1 Tax=Parasitella parasitica TaxID=35722 RepID=A0A0B7MYL4_9FUNG|nr:hypothetical protein [Parasitella parasitica]